MMLALAHRAPPEPPARSPERERLAVAIERVVGLEGYLARVNSADTWAEIAKARRAADAADHKLAEARADEPRRLANRLINGVDDGTITVELAEDDLKAANDQLTLARRTQQAVMEQAGVIEKDLSFARMTRNEAIAQVVATSPAIAKLLAENAAARKRVRELAAIFGVIGPGRLALPAGRAWDIRVDRDLGDFGGAVAPWQAALVALESDADAQLPGEDADPAPPAAA